MKIDAANRLLADTADDAKAQQKKSIDQQLDQKKKQIENLKKKLPSRKNRMKVSPQQKLNTRKDVLRNKEQMIDLQKRKANL